MVKNFPHKLPRLKQILEQLTDQNLRSVPYFHNNLYDQIILLHSEVNSKDLELYQQHDYITAFYWSHALIARDWYRFAEHDKRLNKTTERSKNFLIHCRQWSGTREYRLKFLELLDQVGILKNCEINVCPRDDGTGLHIAEYCHENKHLSVQNFNWLDNIIESSIDGDASADYDVNEFNNSLVSVILETMFDDSRIHLTEKVLRPIACGHPFILAAGPNSLEFLKKYGFKTFSPLIDESYDQEPDSLSRLKMLVQEMKKIEDLNSTDKQLLQQQLQKIADYNQQHFFSKEFWNQVVNELEQNLDTAFKQLRPTRGKKWREIRRFLKKNWPDAHRANQDLDRRRFHWLRSQNRT